MSMFLDNSRETIEAESREGMHPRSIDLGELVARQAGREGQIREEMKLAAEAGDSHTQFCFGFMYLEGLGVPRDYKQASFWFSMAAQQGDPSAQANLGWLYENGFGVPQNDTEAVRWYREAAINGDPYAQLSLGQMYSRGRGFAQHPNAAYIWISMAAWNGVDEAEDEQELLEQIMTRDQISSGWQRAKDCISSGYKDCADI